MRKNLSDRTLKALKPAPPGNRYDIRDAQVPGLIVRVTDTGTRSWMLQARYPGASGPARRALGTYPELSLEKARQKARDWRALLAEGQDPAHVMAAARRAQQRRTATTFAGVAEDFIAEIERRGERKGREVARDIRGEFMTRWGKRPCADITEDDVAAVIKAAVARGAPYQAHNLLGTARRLFGWAIGQRSYGLESSPCDRLKPKVLIGPKKPRTRVLTDDELRAFWRATAQIEYPYGPLFRLLLVTIQRKAEVGEAIWPEIDLARRQWTIPQERMKSDAAHVVPLSQMAADLFASLPRFSGPHVFSTTAGRKPVNGFSRAKERLDALMRAELRELPPFVIHDLRRTGRTHLSALPVTDMVRELVIAHAKPGLHRVYDQWAYLEEKRTALELWEARLRAIVEAEPAAVLPLRGRG